ncbi:glycoside hydrolase family 19 protein [Cupriavidus taiwanensis]|uniref:glycoside hydrolase family 19 protein n=1 Tax=Cupriavidus taiwanensis TaxID=164546 RepID=UPI000E10EADB|nr:glycoside hydrolase family 19 protein [Cupriavidus taiwanensis]SOY56881.1 Glycoside hydrolase family 19 [Cupriavidus taiwanensis]SOY90827.1 Glycoside hydrolase family 19 [Cupriavidus taiwanensis]SOZ63623.1 Glycoside hydrolase family 19 [Cupriavidus taiwanensis]SOZ82633.1 Glycoside hydrolase family 19 [Cupriavidus taiwanensis]SOZ84466.1 Glycoside hydrolase family 19 [Cupriavidus taiwanensis]
MITSKILSAIMPGAGRRADTFLVPLTDAMTRFDIDTPARAAAFLAQVAHESGQLVYVKEIWGPTGSQRRYEGRADLGNTQAGDGKRFMGRGLIQITGRRNYLLCGRGLGLDLVTMPELLEQPMAAAASAGWYWQSNNLNRFADSGDFKALSIAINGRNKATGLPNGWDDRLKYWARAKVALGVAA